jgi:hypothetical protein
MARYVDFGPQLRLPDHTPITNGILRRIDIIRFVVEDFHLARRSWGWNMIGGNQGAAGKPKDNSQDTGFEEM